MDSLKLPKYSSFLLLTSSKRLNAFSVRTQAIINRTQVDYEDYIFSANYTFTL